MGGKARTIGGETDTYRPFDEGTWVPCPIRHSIDYRTNDLVVGFSRKCISSPRWVKQGALAQIWTTAGDEYEDDARLDAQVHSTGFGSLTHRIYRG